MPNPAGGQKNEARVNMPSVKALSDGAYFYSDIEPVYGDVDENSNS